jgi:ATP-dependent exoDNAse (exonuclease V) alpha subunit
MPIYHLSVKAISRSAGRSATAAAAYRAGCKIEDKRTGEIHDYTRKLGVASTDIVLPDGAPNWATDRAQLWNAAEQAEKRKDACVAREFEVALPAELSPAERRRLAVDFAKEMANQEGCAVDVAIHLPNDKHDNRNHHAHILRTTRKVEAEGLGQKLDTEKAGRNRKDDLEAIRARWAELTNERLRSNGIEARVDHRNLQAQGITDREPSQHRGPALDGLYRRGATCFVLERQANERLERAQQVGVLERQAKHTEQRILDLSGDLSAAKASRRLEPPRPSATEIETGKAAAAAWFEQQQRIEAGKALVVANFERWKTEEAAKALAETTEHQRQADLLALQKQAADTQQQAEIERQKQMEQAATKEQAPQRKRDQDNDFSR